MSKTIGHRKHIRLVRDILEAQHDLVSLAERHGMSPEALAAWARAGETRACLSELCTLADLQTQLLLSRYRTLAATRLVRIATADAATDSKQELDVARRACVDLLKLDLKRADGVHDAASNDAESSDLPTGDRVAALREFLYDDVDGNQ